MINILDNYMFLQSYRWLHTQWMIAFHILTYPQTSKIRGTKYQKLDVSRHVLQLSFSCAQSWSQVLSREWRCSWSSTHRQCSNYISVINNFIAYWGASNIRGFMVINFVFTPTIRPSWAILMKRISDMINQSTILMEIVLACNEIFTGDQRTPLPSKIS